MGFGTHPHDNMEIITIPLSGLLKHKDSMGNVWEEVKAGEVQVMSAGTGIQHSEINGSASEFLSLFQIWILPNKNNVTPRYDQHYFEPLSDGELQVLVASIDEGTGVVLPKYRLLKIEVKTVVKIKSSTLSSLLV